MRRMRRSASSVSPVSAVVLVAVNLVPVLGVLFAEWSLFLLLVMYWTEAGVVGAVNVAKIAMARGAAPPAPAAGRRSLAAAGARLSRVVAIPCFVVHYGLCWVLHGVLVLLLPVFVGMGGTLLSTAEAGSTFGLVDLGTIDPRGVVVAVAGLALSHVVSFFVNYLGRGEHLAVSPGAQMVNVYRRVAVPHATVLVAAAIVGALGAPRGALVIVVLAKTALDLAFHLRAHGRTQPRRVAVPPRVQAPGRTAPDS